MPGEGPVDPHLPHPSPRRPVSRETGHERTIGLLLLRAHPQDAARVLSPANPPRRSTITTTCTRLYLRRPWPGAHPATPALASPTLVTSSTQQVPRTAPGVTPHDPIASLLRRWEPEMGANVFRCPQTQRDPVRTFVQVQGSQFDSARP